MIETKRKSLILNVVLTTIILLIGFLFWPGKEKFNQSNPRDVNKTQLKVKVKALNIRKEATVDSPDIGTVYYDELFTVLSHIDNDDYYWYKIKTKQGIEGYIASDRNGEYVEIVSGLIDREAPIINVEKEPLIFIDDEKNYDLVTCEDNSNNCTLTHDDTNPEYIVFKAVDKDDNETVLNVNYYNVYNINTIYYESLDNLLFTLTKKKNNNSNIYNIETTYVINQTIANENKSISYTPSIDFLDENFNKLENINISINDDKLSKMCINNENNLLKKEFTESDLQKGSMLCFDYTFENKDNNIKYIAVGFVGLENADNENNPLSSYYSKYFILD